MVGNSRMQWAKQSDFNPEEDQFIVREWDNFTCSAWGSCTAYWVDGELWVTYDKSSTHGFKGWKTEKGEAAKLLRCSSDPSSSVLWEDNQTYPACMPDENTIRVFDHELKTHYDFNRTSPPNSHFKASIFHGDVFNTPWGETLSAAWKGNELFMVSNAENFLKKKIWRTENGDGIRLVNNGTVRLHWDNGDYTTAYMTNPDTIQIWINNIKYDLTKNHDYNYSPILKCGDTFEYADWGGSCTVIWVDGEVWMAHDTTTTDGTKVWKTICGEASNLLKISPLPTAKILWDNKKTCLACMPDENTIRVFESDLQTYYDFSRSSSPHRNFLSSIKDGDLFNYPHWGGVCTARWVKGELWMARDLNETSGCRVWKTLNGDGRKLVRNGTIRILWDNSALSTAYMPDPDTVRVWVGSKTYDFIRYLPSVPLAILRSGDTFQYDPWGGQCTLMWVNYELWMARDANLTNGTKVWKTKRAESRGLLRISNEPKVPLYCGNREFFKACMPDENTITVHGVSSVSNFVRTSPPHRDITTKIDNGDIFIYPPWGGPCVARWDHGELWLARDLENTSGTQVLKTVEGGGERLISGGVVQIVWDNSEFAIAYLLDEHTIRVWIDNSVRDFKREVS